MGRYVRFARAMATFTSGVIGRLLARRHALEVRVLIEFRRDVRMARLTSLAAYETGRRTALDQAGWLLREGGHGGGQERDYERTDRGHKFTLIAAIILLDALGGVFARVGY